MSYQQIKTCIHMHDLLDTDYQRNMVEKPGWLLTVMWSPKKKEIKNESLKCHWKRGSPLFFNN